MLIMTFGGRGWWLQHGGVVLGQVMQGGPVALDTMQGQSAAAGKSSQEHTDSITLGK